MFPAHLRSGSAACRRQERDTLAHYISQPHSVASCQPAFISSLTASVRRPAIGTGPPMKGFGEYDHRSWVLCSLRRLCFKSGRAGGRRNNVLVFGSDTSERAGVASQITARGAERSRLCRYNFGVKGFIGPRITEKTDRHDHRTH